MGSRVIATRRVRTRLKLIAACLALLALLGGGWLWVRNSSLVSVRHVEVTGLSGRDAGAIRAALVGAARNMTTLDAHVGQLRTAVAPYPVVADLRVSTQFPHGMRIHVIEHLPVGALTAGGRAIAAGADGTLLHDAPTTSLPAVPVSVLPGGTRVTDSRARNALALLAVAPRRLLTRISQVTTSPPHGLVVQLRDGPSLYFGDAADLHAKWIAATEVLADRGSTDASYIDVTDPARPAAGVSSEVVSAAGLATSGASSATSGGSSSTGASSATSSIASGG